MNFSFKFNDSKRKDQINESAKMLADAAESFKKTMQDSATKYNEHRKKAEEEIARGAKLTNHRINL